MPRIVKNTLLKYIPDSFSFETQVKQERVFDFNNYSVKVGYVVYLCEREIRAKDNFALQFAHQKAQELNLPFKIIHPKINYDYEPKQNFITNQIAKSKSAFKNISLDFEIIDNKNVLEYLQKLKTAILIIDFNPILNREWLKKAEFKVYEIDGHNIIPARFVSDKQEYNAATLRRKIYHNIYTFLTEFENLTNEKNDADFILEDFIQNKLPYYAELKNNPAKNIQSGLSKYLNLGFISSQRVALEVIKSKVSDINKETFLEELIVRKELADNFCLYCSNFKSLEDIPEWAKQSLNAHKHDLRLHIYSPKELEQAQTQDRLWNAAQIQLLKNGCIHGYLRMYWAKKVLEWSCSADEALEELIYLNDKYAYDAPSANGYTGILWAIGGLHDRAFQDWFVTGKIRRMTYDSIRRKFDIKQLFI